MIECEGMFGTIIACRLKAKCVVIVRGKERYACKDCKKGFTVVKNLKVN